MENILVAIDDCENTSIASPIMEKTLELARNTMSTVWVVHVAPDTNRPIPFNIDRTVIRREAAAALSNEHAYLQQLAQCLRKRNIDAKALLLEGGSIQALIREVPRLEADLIILGFHKHGLLYAALMGFTEYSMLSNCPCPIMLVPDSGGLSDKVQTN